MAPKTTTKQRHNWHPPVTVPIVAAFVLWYIKYITKEHLLNWTASSDFYLWWRRVEDYNLCACFSFSLWRLYVPVCVRPLPSRDALFKMLLWYLCLLKGLGFLLTPCRISPPLLPFVGGNQCGTCCHRSTCLGKYLCRGRKGCEITLIFSSYFREHRHWY